MEQEGDVDVGLTPGLRTRAKKLFYLSDLENKGFIVRRDMQRMRSEVPLPPEQLEAVFDSLDRGGNGFLTLQQFLHGFGSFLSSGCTTSNRTKTISTSSDQEDQCALYVEKLALRPSIQTSALKQLSQLISKEGSQQIQVELESALKQLDEDLSRVEGEQRSLQEAMRIRGKEHDERVRKLFEEMETHLSEERNQLTAQFESRLAQLKTSMEEELTYREQRLQEVTSQLNEKEEKMQHLLSLLTEEQRNAETLRKEKEELTECCAQQSLELKQLSAQRGWTRAWRATCKSDNHDHMASGFKMAKAMFRQEQGLLEQLKILRSLAETLESVRHQNTTTQL